jgi:hypothetical protein
MPRPDLIATLRNDYPTEKNPMLRIAPDDDNPILIRSIGARKLTATMVLAHAAAGTPS